MLKFSSTGQHQPSRQLIASGVARPMLALLLLAVLTLLRPFAASAQYNVSTLAGSGTPGSGDGTGSAAQFFIPSGVALDGAGNVYVADQRSNRIRKVTPAGVVTTLAGAGAGGFADGAGSAAQFNNPSGVAVDGAGNVYVADQGNQRIRKVTPAGVTTTLAGTGLSGFTDGAGSAAQFNNPTGVAVDGAGNVYVADQVNNRIRKVTPAGVTTTLAGSAAGFSDGTGVAARFFYPTGVAVDGANNVYVADQLNNRIRKVTPAGVTTTLAGSAAGGFADGTGSAAQFNNPSGVALDGAGNVYVADQSNNRIRRVTPAGVTTTLAGTGTPGFADGVGSTAQFNSPYGVAVDGAGNVYVADQSNNRIRKAAPFTVAVVTTTNPTGVTATTATLGGNVTSDGGNPVTENGVVYSSTNPTPTVGDPASTKQSIGTGTGSFSATTTGLTASTSYYVVAYATNGAGTAYGAVLQFTTLAPAPTLTSLSPTSGPVGTSVTLTGTDLTGATGVSFNGTAATTFVVVNATTVTATVPTGATTGNVTVTTPGGTSNGISFTVTTAPTVTTTTPTSTTTTTATLGGNVTSDGGSAVTDRGVVYVAGSGTPSIGGTGVTKTAASPATGTGSYTIGATGLLPATTYTVRAYATNAQGTSYGAAQSFATSAITAVAWTGAVSTNWATAGNWAPAAVPTASIDVTIPAAPVNQPVVSGLQVAQNVTVQTGAILTLAATTAPTTQLTLGTGSSIGGTPGSLVLALSSTLIQAAASELYITGDLTNNGARFGLDPTSEVGFGGISHVINGTTGITFQTMTVGEQGSSDFLTMLVPVQVRRKLGVYNNSGASAGTGGSLTMLSDATGTALVENGCIGCIVSGPVTVQRYINPSLNAGAGYRHYSAPVSNTTVGDLATLTGFTPTLTTSYNTSATPGTTTPFPTVFGYDQSRVTLTNPYAPFDRGFVVPAAATTALAVGRGYAVNIAGNQLVDFVGTLTTGDQSALALSRVAGNADAGWQLVGNPYPAPLDYSLVAPADRANLDAAMYVYSSTGPYAGQYRSYVSGVGNSVLPVAQGFFVRVSSGQTGGSLTFRNAQRLTAPNATAFQRTTDTRPLVQLELAGTTGPTDVLYAYAQTGATPAYDNQFDAEKLANPTGLNLSSTATSGQRLAIDGRPVFDTATALPLAVGVPAAGAYTLTGIALDNLPAGLDAYLLDAQTGQTVNLRTQPSYAFSVTTAQAQALLVGRFTLSFAARTALATAPALTAAQMQLYPNPAHGAFAVLMPGVVGATAVQAELLNALGQVVRRQSAALPASGTTLTVETSGLAAGVYTLRLRAGNAALAKRVVLN